uniref:Uncharacterized protein n=1 Tax=Rhizophora mucronata TaxID=61149 RepID=A0A2P2J376_RHIMU
MLSDSRLFLLDKSTAKWICQTQLECWRGAGV